MPAEKMLDLGRFERRREILYILLLWPMIFQTVG